MLKAAWIPSESSYDLVVAPSLGGSQETLTLNVTAGNAYYLSGDGESDDLVDLLETLLNTHSGISSLELEVDNETLQATVGLGPAIDFADSNTTFPSWVIGMGDTDALLSTATPSPLVWNPGVDISFDSRDRDVLIRGRRTSLSGLVYTTNFVNAKKRRSITYELIEQEHVLEEYADVDYTAFETMDRLALSLGVPFRVYEGTEYSTYRLSEEAEVIRNEEWTYRWDVALSMRSV